MKKVNKITMHKTQVITQDRLGEYADLCETLRSLQKERQTLRAQLISDLHADADIEEGEFIVLFTTFSAKRLTWDKLTDLLGETRTNAIRDKIQSDVSDRLEVKLAQKQA